MEGNIDIRKNEKFLELETWYNSIEAYQKKDLTFDFEKEVFFSIHLDDTLIGIMSICEDDRRINNLKRFVIIEHRNKGYASMLLEYLIEYALNNNFISIKGELRIESKKGINFFKEKGFRIIPFDKHVTSVMLSLIKIKQ